MVELSGRTFVKDALASRKPMKPDEVVEGHFPWGSKYVNNAYFGAYSI